MLRKKAVAIAVSLLMPSLASALGLGALKATSSLNEPFDGRIEILGASATDYDTLRVKLADSQQFERAGVLREAVLLSLKFEIVETPAGNDFIRISTREPVREPFLNFLLELNWANGRMVREYTVLLDPPLYDPNRRAPAPSLAPRPLAPPAAVAPVPAPAAAPMPAAAPAYGAAGNVTAESADTAWGLALRHRPDAGVSVQRMMIALLRANPEAFVNGNVNMLRRGAVLRLPGQAELDGLSQAEAMAEVARQHQLWEEYRQGATSAAPAQPMGVPAVSETPAEAEAPSEDLSIDEALAADEQADDARLELVAPETGAATAAGEPGAAADEGASAALVEEDLTTKSQENQELQAKLEEASEIIDLLQRQVEIKDGELASLQARLAELGVETAPAAQPVPAAPEAPAGETPAKAEAAAEPAPAPTAEAAPEPAAEAAAPEPAAGTEPQAPAAPEQAPAKKPAQPVAPEAAAPAAGVLDSLLPAHIRDAVPGGAVTVLGVLGSLLALVLAMLGRKLSRGRGKTIGTATRPATAAAVAVTATTLEAEPEVSPTVAEFIAPVPEETADRFARTLEASAEELAPDPLEEVNVYLAYERFDQAEELVKKVIQQYPNEHKYKLRLLEIYYSANNKAAYEEHARTLLDAVGEQHPLWENALAMWNEMSPNRALFAPGAPEPATAVVPASAEFVDITGDAPVPGADTMSMAPGVESALAATAVGLTNELPGEDAAVDFDLTETAGDLDFEQMLDLTGGEPAGDHDVIDLTATADQQAVAGFIDLTAPEAAPAEDYSEIFDISGDEESLNIGDTLKLDSETFAAAAAAASATVPPTDLLDISDTGDMDFALNEPLLSSTVDALADTASGHGLQAPAAAPPAEEAHLDFDISDTVAPPVGAEEGPGSAEIEADALAADATSTTLADDTLDFDIDALSLDIEPEAPAAAAPPPSGSAAEDIDFSLDLDPEAVADANLALRNPLFDMQIDDRLTSTGNTTLERESELDFDLALQDTTDFDQLGVDDTLELPSTSGAATGSAPMSESLEDLTRSMDASLAGLDLEEEPVDDSLLDLDLGSLGTDAIDLDFSIGDIGRESAAGTGPVALDNDEFALERTGLRLDQSAGAQHDGESRFAHESDEADTKLNLAKAYIELGDSEGARTILDEVTREGSAAQQQEARQLLSQLA